METRFSLFIADSRCLACTYRAKFVEVSVGINHNVDELLAGILTQIRLKKEQNSVQVSITIDLSTLFFFFDILFLFPFLWQQFFFLLCSSRLWWTGNRSRVVPLDSRLLPSAVVGYDSLSSNNPTKYGKKWKKRNIKKKLFGNFACRKDGVVRFYCSENRLNWIFWFCLATSWEWVFLLNVTDVVYSSFFLHSSPSEIMRVVAKSLIIICTEFTLVEFQVRATN